MHFLIGLFIKVLKKSKIVLTIHGSEIKLFEKYKSLRFILYIYDAILVVSNEQLQIISNLVGQKVIHIPNAIDSKFFEQPISSPKYSLSPKNKKKVSIVSIGSLRWQKNHAMLIKGISLSKYKDEIELNLVGVGAEIDSLKDLAKRTNVDINFTGTLNQDDVIKILDTSDLFILPSIVEGAPKALIEAMARGIYCITTPVGDCQSILNGSGHCLSSFSPADLALQIDKYLDYPLEMETAQIKKLTKTYTWKNYLKIHSKIYENL
jgi:glycosyltransferase involved in cell wall biosynthesis